MIQVNDVLNLTKNYARNQNLDTTRGIQVINTAMQFVKSQISLPGHESEDTFLFFEDQTFYPAPSDFGEPIFLRYEKEKYNRDRRFEFRPGELLFEKIRDKAWHRDGTRLWGYYYGTGVPQIMVIARNKKASILIDSFDYKTNVSWIGGGDAVNLHYDPYTFVEGTGASLAFDVVANVANRASLIGTALSPFDFSSVQNVGHFRVAVYLPSTTDFDSVSLNWGSDNANYFKQVVTTQNNAVPFVVGWNYLDLPWDGTQTQIGSPNIQQMSYFQLDYDYTAGFSAPAYSFRADNLQIIVPDTMKMSYYTTHVAVSITGTPLVTLQATSDVFLFGTVDPALMELVALQAAVILNPQILVDDKSVRQLYADFTTLYKRTYPKKKINNLMADPLITRTSH